MSRIISIGTAVPGSGTEQRTILDFMQAAYNDDIASRKLKLNMSSPTILFVLNELMQAEHKPDETIFSIGFGPGLSIETALLSYAG
jgi:predicted naringenin-chalcone synthase